MNNVFITTNNVTRCAEMCRELEDPASLIGPSLAVISGPPGRGKSEFAKEYATNSRAIYIPPLNIRTPTMLLREIAFELGTVRPRSADACLAVIGEEMERERRLVMIDEADLLPISILEMMRNVNERYTCPVLLIGEKGLKGKIASRGRLASRIRRLVEFGPVAQADIALFYRKALELEITPGVVGILHSACGGDWRPVLTAAIAVEGALSASGKQELTEALAKAVTANGKQKK